METNLPTRTTAKVELLIYQRVYKNHKYKYQKTAIFHRSISIFSLVYQSVLYYIIITISVSLPSGNPPWMFCFILRKSIYEWIMKWGTPLTKRKPPYTKICMKKFNDNPAIYSVEDKHQLQQGNLCFFCFRGLLLFTHPVTLQQKLRNVSCKCA